MSEHLDPPDGGNGEGFAVPANRKRSAWAKITGALLLAAFLAAAGVFWAGKASPPSSRRDANLPPDGISLRGDWGSLGARLVAEGVIDENKLRALYAPRGGLPPEMERLLRADTRGPLSLTPRNARALLTLFWALGLAERNAVLTAGPLRDPQYGDGSRFASTGGWTLATGDAMAHYAWHDFLVLTPEEEAEVGRVARHIFRPCCGNSTYFPDCNHGMAMLGLLEFMAASGAGEEELFRAALAANAAWFPDEYRTIAAYYAHEGRAWEDVRPQEALSASVSSATGYQTIAAAVSAWRRDEPANGSGSCGA